MNLGFNLRSTPAQGMACLWVALLAGCAANRPAPTPPDTSDPKQTAMAFAKAVTAGDMRAVHELATGSNAEFKMVKGLSDSVRTLKRLDTALTQKFGLRLPREMRVDLPAQVASADVKIDGNTAILLYAGERDESSAPRIRKSGGRWKMDLSYATDEPTADDFQKAMLKHLNQVAADIEAGKYKTYDDAMEAMQNGPQLPATPAGRK